MKQKLLLFLIVLSFSTVFSQEISLNIGTNFTQFNLKNPENYSGTPLQIGTGSSFEVAYLMPSTKEKLNYTFGLGIHEYNALAGNFANSYRWNTKYLGLRTGFEYNFLELPKFQLVPLFGIQFASIIYGKQEINGSFYDITSNADFKGLKLIPYMGFKVKYAIKNNGFVSIGYNHSTTFKPSLTTKEHLTIATNQVVFGLHFNVNN